MPALRILHLEDDPTDAELIQTMLEGEGIRCVMERVQSREQFDAALERNRFDLIISDFALPAFDGLSALAMARHKVPDVPFLFVSGAIGEEFAVESLKQGAVDYVLKDRLGRLGSAARRAIRERQERTERKRIEEELRQRNELFRQITENVDDLVAVIDLEGRRVFNSPSYRPLLGDPVAGADAFAEIHPEDRERVRQIFHQTVATGAGQRAEYRFLLKNGAVRHIESQGSVIRDAEGKLKNIVVVSRDVTERKQAEQALIAAETKFRTLVEQSLVGIYIIQDGKLVYVNPKMEEILGYTRSELASLPLLGLIVEEDRALVAEKIRERMDRVIASAHYEVQTRRKDGTIIRVEVRGNRTEYNGQPAILGTLLDITERKLAEGRIREQAALLDIAPDAICVTDIEQRILYWNRGAEQLYQWTAQEAIGENANELLFQGEVAAPLAALKNLIAKNEWHGELHQVTKTGEKIIVESRWALTRDDAGKPKSILVINSDITERRQAEIKIHEQAALLDKATDAIFVRDLEQRITYWNKGAERLYGRTAAEVLGKKASELLYKEDSPQRQEIWKAVLEKGEWSGELVQVTKSGSEIVVQSRRTLLRDAEGKPAAVLNINTDVTAQKQIEAQLLRAQRMENIGALAGGVAHDLNNVLGPILMVGHLLRDELASLDSRKMLDTATASAQRGAEMVKQILSFARGAVGEPVALQVGHLVQEMGKLAKDTFPKSIHVQTKVAKELRLVMGDATQIHQVLLNLCVNARDAMPEGGTLTLEADNVVLDHRQTRMQEQPVSGPHVILTVSDTGAGIPPELLDRIFEPFFTTKEPGKGTGLGLSTVMSILKHHAGFLEVSSQIGRGTTFRVYLPAAAATRAESEIQQPPPPPMGKGEQVLLVEDELAILEITKETLETFNYRVLTATDGVEAVTLYRQRKGEIDIVVTDLMMPIMDGPALIRALRQIDPQLKIMAISGLGSAASVADAQKLNVQGFVTKPFTTDKLLTALRDVLASR